MRVTTVDLVDHWTHGPGLVAVVVLVALAWGAVFVPGGVFWTAVLVAGLISAAVATAVLAPRRPIRSLAQVIASAEAETVVAPAHRGYAGGARLRPRGEREP
jgi:hypothetical protein